MSCEPPPGPGSEHNRDSTLMLIDINTFVPTSDQSALCLYCKERVLIQHTPGVESDSGWVTLPGLLHCQLLPQQ